MNKESYQSKTWMNPEDFKIKNKDKEDIKKMYEDTYERTEKFFQLLTPQNKEDMMNFFERRKFINVLNDIKEQVDIRDYAITQMRAQGYELVSIISMLEHILNEIETIIKHEFNQIKLEENKSIKELLRNEQNEDLKNFLKSKNLTDEFLEYSKHKRNNKGA